MSSHLLILYIFGGTRWRMRTRHVHDVMCYVAKNIQPMSVTRLRKRGHAEMRRRAIYACVCGYFLQDLKE